MPTSLSPALWWNLHLAASRPQLTPGTSGQHHIHWTSPHRAPSRPPPKGATECATLQARRLHSSCKASYLNSTFPPRTLSCAWKRGRTRCGAPEAGRLAGALDDVQHLLRLREPERLVPVRRPVLQHLRTQQGGQAGGRCGRSCPRDWLPDKQPSCASKAAARSKALVLYATAGPAGSLLASQTLCAAGPTISALWPPQCTDPMGQTQGGGKYPVP